MSLHPADGLSTAMSAPGSENCPPSGPAEAKNESEPKIETPEGVERTDDPSGPIINLQADNRGIFKCELCPRTFRFLFQWRDHMRKHSQGRVFECYVCKGYYLDSQLDAHHRKHTGERVYKRYSRQVLKYMKNSRHL